MEANQIYKMNFLVLQKKLNITITVNVVSVSRA